MRFTFSSESDRLAAVPARSPLTAPTLNFFSFSTASIACNSPNSSAAPGEDPAASDTGWRVALPIPFVGVVSEADDARRHRWTRAVVVGLAPIPPEEVASRGKDTAARAVAALAGTTAPSVGVAG